MGVFRELLGEKWPRDFGPGGGGGGALYQAKSVATYLNFLKRYFDTKFLNKEYRYRAYDIWVSMCTRVNKYSIRGMKIRRMNLMNFYQNVFMYKQG